MMESHFKDPSDPHLVSALQQEIQQQGLEWDQGPLSLDLRLLDLGNTQHNIREGILFNHAKLCNRYWSW